MDIPEEAERAWQAYSISKGGTANFPGPIRDAYLAGAEWARKQTLEEATTVAEEEIDAHVDAYRDIADGDLRAGGRQVGRSIRIRLRALAEGDGQ